MRGREASDSKKSHEDLANFQRTLNERGQEMFDSGTNGSKAIKSGPQVLAALSLGNALSGLPRWCSSKESACQCRKQETWVWSLGQEDHPEDEVTTHSSILAWRIPWTEEPGSGLQKVGVAKSRTRQRMNRHACAPSRSKVLRGERIKNNVSHLDLNALIKVWRQKAFTGDKKTNIRRLFSWIW